MLPELTPGIPDTSELWARSPNPTPSLSSRSVCPPQTPACAQGLQVGELSGLRCLRLRGVAYGSGGFEVLRRLTSLEHLQLDRCRLPACLPALAGLRCLHLRACTAGQGCEDELAEGVAAALRRLNQLTSLALVQLPAAACSPQSMAGLCQLQCLAVLPCSSSIASGIGSNRATMAPRGTALPPWPPCLRSLTAPFALVSASLAWLSAARQLSRLCLTDCPSASGIAPGTWLAFFAWAETHAPLASFEFAAAPPQHAAPLRKACARLAAKRPAMRLVSRSAGQTPALAPQEGWPAPASNKT